MSERAEYSNAWRPSTPIIGREFEAPLQVAPAIEGRHDHRKHAVAYLAAFLMLASIFAIYTVPAETLPVRATYTIHSPIYIEGDADLVAQAGAASWPGDGSVSNPILIRDYEIDASLPGYGIAILNTRLHLAIDSCHIFGGSMAGVFLQNVTNATVIRSIVESCGAGIALENTFNCTVVGNRCSYSTDGFYLSGVSNTGIMNNTADQNTEGVYAYFSSFVEFTNCSSTYNVHGFYLESCENVTVNECNGTNNSVGLYVITSHWIMVSNSTFSYSITEGLWFEGSFWFMSSKNSASHCGSNGFYASLSDYFMVSNNNFSHDSNGAYIYYGVGFGFENNTILSNANQGILMDHCTNFGMRNNSISDSNIGIAASYTNSTIGGNTVWYCNYGIYLQYSDGGDIDSNICSYNSVGVFVEQSTRVTVWNNTCTWCFTAGVYLDSVTDSRIGENNCSNGTSVLLLLYSDNNEIQGNICSGNSVSGIDLEFSNDNMLSSNHCNWNTGRGIYLIGSARNTISYSSCSDNFGAGLEVSAGSDGANVTWSSFARNLKGILVQSSRDANITHNYCDSNAQGGIAIEYSLNVTLMLNTLELNGVWLDGPSFENWCSHRIDTSNQVNFKPLVYMVNRTSTSVTEDAGQVLLAGCNDVQINAKDLSNATAGLECGFSVTILLTNSRSADNYYGAYYYQTVDFQTNKCVFLDDSYGVFGMMGSYMMVDNSTFSRDQFGIALQNVNSAIIADNHIDHAESYGMYLDTVSGSQVRRNFCNYSGTALEVMTGSYLDISNNTLNWNVYGMALSQSFSSVIDNNTCSYNRAGVYMVYCTDMVLKYNKMVKDGILILGGYLENWNSHSISTTNTANGKPVYYFKDVAGFAAPTNGGQIILANCNHVSISDADLMNATVGVSIGFSTEVSVSGVNCSGGALGIMIVASSLCTVNGSDFSHAQGYGIYLEQSSSCLISNNTMVKDRTGLYAYSSTQNKITRNLFYEDQLFAIELESGSSQNSIWNNTFAFNCGSTVTYNASRIQAYDGSGGNFWYVTGPIHGWGNYWSDWTTPDVDKDGIVDDPYNIMGSAGAQDFYPLVNPATPMPIPEFGLLLVVPLAMMLVLLLRRRLH